MGRNIMPFYEGVCLMNSSNWTRKSGKTIEKYRDLVDLF